MSIHPPKQELTEQTFTVSENKVDSFAFKKYSVKLPPDSTSGNGFEEKENAIASQRKDSLLRIVENATNIAVFLVKQTIVNKDSDVFTLDSIASYPVKRKEFVKSEELKAVLKFILLDKGLLINKSALVKQPYAPYLAIDFSDELHKLVFFLSFGTDEIGIVDNEGKELRYQVSTWRQLARWCSMIFTEDQYIKSFKDE